MNNNIGIAGLGWLGLPLARKLQVLGFSVKGTVTRLENATELQKKGFDAYPMTITEQGVNGSSNAFLMELDIVIVMIPPGLRRNTGADYVLKMSHFLEHIKKAEIEKCIFVSSTSVYADHQGLVTETVAPKPESEAGRQLLQVEQLFSNSLSQTTILRFGGLIGGSRQPVRYLAGRENLSGGNAPVNLIHREDCLNIILEIIKQDCFGVTFNAVAPIHPKKKEYYVKKAEELQLVPPHYSESEEASSYKQVDSENLRKILGYSFRKQL